MRRADPSSSEVLPSVCMSLIMIKRNNKPLLLELLGRGGQTKQEEINRNLFIVGMLSR